MKPLLIVLVLLGVIMQVSCSTATDSINIVPWPKSIETGKGTFEMTAKGKIVARDKELMPLAEVLSEEIFMSTGLRLKAAEGKAGEGDVILVYNPGLKDETYEVEVSSTATISGGNYGAVALGTVTFLQAVTMDGKKVIVPEMTVKDTPRSSYRSLLVDVARKWHSVDTLKQVVVLARLYKIRYIQLHLTDDQSFTFPSTAFPKLPTPNRHYTVDELKDLVHFADVRGVTLVPEFDGPGHTGSMRNSMPETFGSGRLGVLNMADETIYENLEKLVAEICDVFDSSPYFHIGADEAWLGNFEKEEKTNKAVKDREFDSAHDLMLDYIVRMDQMVRKNGKKTVMWESFQGTGSRKVQIPKDILVMAWETMYQLPQSLLENGYTIINSTWKPCYVLEGNRWSQEYIYMWNMFRWENYWNVAPSYNPIQLEPNDKIIGGQMCAWEMREWFEIPALRVRLPAMSERIWDPDSNLSYENFRSRWESTDLLLQKLIRPIDVKVVGLTYPDYYGESRNRENWFGDSITVTMNPTVEGSKIHYTLDDSVPTMDSSIYEKPLKIDETTIVKAQVFGPDKKPLGFMSWTNYEHQPITDEVEGLLLHLTNDRPWDPWTKFGDSVTIKFASEMKNGTIRYTLNDRSPDAKSTEYTGPITLDKTTTVTARFIDNEGNPRGETWKRRFEKIDWEKNLATLKPVTASMDETGHPAKSAVDGVVDREVFWNAGPAPQWLQVDLQKVYKLNRINVVMYWDSRRFYQYTIEVSVDGKNWKQVVDRKKNTEVSTPNGYNHEIEPTDARYVKVNMLHNSANPGLHIVELRVYEEK